MAAIVTCCDIWHKVRSPTGKVAKDEEVKDMLDTVFGKSEAPKPDPGGSDSNDKNVSEDDIATDKDVADMLNKVFG